MGSPTRIVIGMPRSRKFRGRPFVQMRCVPQMATGVSGVPVSMANRACFTQEAEVLL